jgi:hypothetical protein
MRSAGPRGASLRSTLSNLRYAALPLSFGILSLKGEKERV